MWPTVDGLRKLRGAEANLVRRAIAEMVRKIETAEEDGGEDLEPCGIDWFDQWDGRQRLWMLEQIAAALLEDDDPPSPAAMWEATVDAVFCEVITQITAEVERESLSSKATTWRELTIEAFRRQTHQTPHIDAVEMDAAKWRKLVTQISDLILGVPCYQKAESFRDQDIRQLHRFLNQKGLPNDFLERIPPLRTEQQARESIERIEQMIRRDAE